MLLTSRINFGISVVELIFPACCETLQSLNRAVISCKELSPCSQTSGVGQIPACLQVSPWLPGSCFSCSDGFIHQEVSTFCLCCSGVFTPYLLIKQEKDHIGMDRVQTSAMWVWIKLLVYTDNADSWKNWKNWKNWKIEINWKNYCSGWNSVKANEWFFYSIVPCSSCWRFLLGFATCCWVFYWSWYNVPSIGSL